MVFERPLSRVCGDLFVAFEDVWSKMGEQALGRGAFVSKEGRSGSVRTAYLRSELTLGDGKTKKSRFSLGFGRFY